VDAVRAQGALNQIAYGLIFERDLDDQAVAGRVADAIVDGRTFSAGTGELSAAVDHALAEQRIPASTLGMVDHSEPALLAFLARLRRALDERLPPAR
jgi:hypothetical protein